MDKTLKVVVKNVNEPPQVITIKDEYTELRKLVGGYIETVPFAKGRLLLVCNDEGKLDGLPPNLCLRGDIICGNCFITKFDGKEDFESLSESDISFVTKELDKVTLKDSKQLAAGCFEVVTLYGNFDGACVIDEQCGKNHLTSNVPIGEPILGFLQDREKLGKEITTKKEREELEHE